MEVLEPRISLEAELNRTDIFSIKDSLFPSRYHPYRKIFSSSLNSYHSLQKDIYRRSSCTSHVEPCCSMKEQDHWKSAAECQSPMEQNKEYQTGLTPREKRRDVIKKRCNKVLTSNSEEEEVNRSNVDAAADSRHINKGIWTKEEHELFLKGYNVYGNNWKKIAYEFVKTRTRSQLASHAQKYFSKCKQLKELGLSERKNVNSKTRSLFVN